MSENKQENEKNTSRNKSSEPVQELEPQVIGGGLDPEFDDDKDMIFQAQMGVHQFLIANWKNLLSITIVFLLGVLIYGTYTNSVVEEQRGIHSELAKIQKRLPDTLVTGATHLLCHFSCVFPVEILSYCSFSVSCTWVT